MYSPELFVAIPKNSRLKEDVSVGVEDALKLEVRDYGVQVSPDLPGVNFVSRRLTDILKGMRDRVYGIGSKLDDIANVIQRRFAESGVKFAPLDFRGL